MIPSVTDKSLIPAPSWRRHTDPPFLWIAVFISSVSLHLLVFWLLRSSNEFQPWIPHSNQAVVPVDLIDIPLQVQSTAKPKSTVTTVKPKLPSSNQKFVTPSLPKTEPTIPDNADDVAINPDFNHPQDNTDRLRNLSVEGNRGSRRGKKLYPSNIVPQEPQTGNTKVNNEPVPQPVDSTPTPRPTETPIPTPRPTETPIPTPRPTETQTIPLNNLPWNRRQEVKLGQGTLLPKDIPSDSPTPTQEASSTPTQEPSPTPTEEPSPTPTEEPSPTPTQEPSPTPTQEASSTPTPGTSPTPTGGGVLANLAPIPKEEVNQLIQQNRLRKDGLPDVMAEYQGSNSKELDSSFLPSDSGIKSANILASLVIDKNGNFQQAVVLEIEPATLLSEKSIYEQALNDIFKQDKFMPAYNQDGSKPELSNLYMRIKIEIINSQ